MLVRERHYRAIKYVWKPEWIGKEAHEKEVLAAQQACIADIVSDFSIDCESRLSDAEIRLVIIHIKKYSQCTIINYGDHCYIKIKVEVDLQPK